MWNDIVNANCARAKATASQPSTMTGIRPHCCETGFTMPRVGAVPFCRCALRGSAVDVQQAPDGAIDLLVLAFAVMMEHDLSILINDVLCGPILVAVRIPGL